MAQRIRGEGSVYWSDSMKRFVAAYIVGDDGKKKRFYGPLGDRSRAARLGVVQRLEAYSARNPRNASRQTIATYVTAHIDRSAVRPATAHGYRSLHRRYLEGSGFGNLPIRDVDHKAVRAFMETLDATDNEKRKLYSLLHAVFEAAIEREDIGSTNPLERVKKPRVRKVDRRIWTPEEALRFLRVARSHRLYAVFLLAICAGMGPAELFGLQRSSVNLKGRYLIVQHDLVEVDGVQTLEETKNEYRRRRIDLDEVTIAALRDRFEAQLAEGHGSSTYVFTSPKTGGPLNLSRFHRDVWLPLVKRSGLPRMRPYDLRHLHNAVAGFLGIPVQVMKERLGHSTISMTVDTYGHNYESMQRAVAEKFTTWLSEVG